MKLKLVQRSFYPVDVDNKIIHLERYNTKDDVRHLWNRKHDAQCIAVTGRTLMSNPMYAEYRLKPTMSVSDLIKEWAEEGARSLYLWKSAALAIGERLRQNTPEEALAAFRKMRSQCRTMAVSASYGRAVNQLTDLLEQIATFEAWKNSMLEEAEAQVANLKEQGWTQADFARELANELVGMTAKDAVT